eukprot:2205963-Rhodomonas_salina.1
MAIRNHWYRLQLLQPLAATGYRPRLAPAGTRTRLDDSRPTDVPGSASARYGTGTPTLDELSCLARLHSF